MTLFPKRLAWRVGRKLYCGARGEQRSAAIRLNGEADIQAKVLAAISIDVPLQAIDIGANQGEWTSSLLSQASPERRTSARLRIDAFEPFPATADRFEQELSHVPGRETLHLHRFAISDIAGAERLAVTSATGGTNTLHFDQTAGDPPGGWCEVCLDTLDAFCASSGIGHIHLAKCDTEGHDAKVLKGALGLLSPAASTSSNSNTTIAGCTPGRFSRMSSISFTGCPIASPRCGRRASSMSIRPGIPSSTAFSNRTTSWSASRLCPGSPPIAAGST